LENNYRTVLIEDACRGVNEKEIEVKRTELNENGCIFVDSNVVSEKFSGDFFDRLFYPTGPWNGLW
jgi:hypothetical protein